MLTKAHTAAAGALIKTCAKRNLTIATAESCTGGLLSGLITSIPGSSDVFCYGFITYANQAKTELLGVSPALLKKHGAVSEHVAAAMAKGARKKARADIAVAITGIAGPTGGTKSKPVGLVYIAVASKEHINTQCYHFKGTRQKIRLEAVAKATHLLKEELTLLSASF